MKTKARPTMTLTLERRALFGIVVMILATGLLLLQIPRVDDIVKQRHAVERHGEDAIRARQGLARCKAENLRVRICPSAKYALTLAFWCERPGAVLCPGAYTTIAGIEKTAFIRPCAEWRECK